MDKGETLTKFGIKMKLVRISVYIVQQKIKILLVVTIRPYTDTILFYIIEHFQVYYFI